MMRAYFSLVLLVFSLGLSACAGPYSGPDKQFVGMFKGAATGAGAGAVTGSQLSAGSLPGAAVGAGFGAIAGGVQGYLQDQQEEHLIAMMQDTSKERARAYAHEVLADHYKRRMELHPTRDIFPAELFFFADDVHLRREANHLVKELTRLNLTRYPWSRFVVAAYVRSKDESSEYAKHLALERARNLSQSFVRAGLDPRRVQARGVVIDSPLVKDPHDSKDRYSQAIELIPLDAK